MVIKKEVKKNILSLCSGEMAVMSFGEELLFAAGYFPQHSSDFLMF